MIPVTPESGDRDSQPAERPSVRDRRLRPRGVLPRSIQTWLMAGIAVVILLIILITGRPQPPASPVAQPQPAVAALTPPERIRGFERQLSDDETRLRDMAARADAQARFADTPPVPERGAVADTRRAQGSELASDNIAFSRRTDAPYATRGARPGDLPQDPAGPQTLPELAALEQWLKGMSALMPSPLQPNNPAPVPPPTANADTVAPASAMSATREAEPPTGRLRVLEGTVIEAVLLNRLDGTYAGPVSALVTSPVYSQDRHHVVIPAGARVLGAATPVQSWGEARLAVSFHRLLMPDGRTYSLDLFKGLSQVGETGLRDRVNRHYWRAFGASLAVGALSGLAQLHTRTGVDVTFANTAAQDAGSSLATSAARILDRYLNVLPTITIREGYRLKVYLTGDFDLPPYKTIAGGAQ